MKYTNKQLRAIYRSLPSDIKEVISSVECTDKIQAIGKKYKLLIDKVGALSEETGFVLRGITKPQDFVNNIQNRLEVSKDIAVSIAEEINTQIFYELRESLKQILNKKTETFENEKEENLNREDILREIEDKEHHNLPTVSAQELHLEASPPSELVVKQPDEIMITTNNTHLGARPPSEIAPFQKMKTGDVKIEEPPEMIIIRPKQEQKKPNPSQEETIQAMRGDIFKDKMSGTVSVPKEMVEIGDSTPPPKRKLPDVGNIDPYRERAE